MVTNPASPENSKLHPKFLGLWRRALALPSLSDLNAELVRDWANHAGLEILGIAERDVGVSRLISAIVLSAHGGTACFPRVSHTSDPSWLTNRKASERVAAMWEKMEWFQPFWVSHGQIGELLADAGPRPKAAAIQRFDYHTSTIYTLAFQAVCIAQFMPLSRSLVDFAPVAREAYLAFYAGYRAASIAALIPVMEGAIKRISGGADSLSTSEHIDRIVDRACERASARYFEGMWVPREYSTKEFLYGQDECVFGFETYRQWLKGAFFARTGEYDGVTWLNRHLFAHGASSEWHNAGNFRRLVVAIATLGVVESWHDNTNGVPIFFPEMNDDSRLLHQQALLQAQAQMQLKLYEQQQYHRHGRLVPDMPTDDGVLLRRARLEDDCINDLVRPLRNAGWSVEMGKPDEQATYVKAVASCGDAVVRVALLFTCATDNAVYRELAKDSDVILYRGAPYDQSGFAYGIDIHVGPVAAWQPPNAPGR